MVCRRKRQWKKMDFLLLSSPVFRKVQGSSGFCCVCHVWYTVNSVNVTRRPFHVITVEFVHDILMVLLQECCMCFKNYRGCNMKVFQIKNYRGMPVALAPGPVQKARGGQPSATSSNFIHCTRTLAEDVGFSKMVVLADCLEVVNSTKTKKKPLCIQ
jgi:hypothetical protein